jgi:hypothetical protein
VIQNAFNAINGNDFNSFIYDCGQCRMSQDPTLLAYVNPKE